ncbi:MULTISPECIES: hypothetical protein [Mammaliicoccus]|uniref:Uncharacterized protein n=1 Tax=Mammaliicoccus lentus TaxID=42858 RepID=A0ABS6GXL9_MAMLE|nr:hypothetical protein [Mammaliicoccus lentus]MBF0842731.1 hypothetical protein [Mammaliicoccus lentus]MBU6114184.1 hypothetical protein [Mammaliicoccus lentus]
MNKRYQKVLLLYLISTLVPYTLLNKNKDIQLTKSWLPSSLIGYGIFAYGLKILTQLKKASK